MHITTCNRHLAMLRDFQTSPAAWTVPGCRRTEILLIPCLARASDAASAVSHMSRMWSLCVPGQTKLLQCFAELQLKLSINPSHFLDPLTCADTEYADTEFAFQTRRLKFLKRPLEDSGELQMVHFQLRPHNPGYFGFYMNHEFWFKVQTK